MYKNLFAACLILSIGFHAVIAAFVITHKPSERNTSSTFVQQVSLVERLKTGAGAVKPKTDKDVLKFPGTEQSKTSSGPDNIKAVINSTDAEHPSESKADSSDKVSTPGNDKGAASPSAGTAGTGEEVGAGKDKYAHSGDAGSGNRYGITKARLLKGLDIRYDETSRRRGEEGSVSIDLVIDKSGNPRNVRIKQSSGYPRLDRVAMNGIRSSRFSPTMKSGRPVDSQVEYTIIFRLDNTSSGLKIVEDDRVNILE
jgi:TonB family protein